MLAHNLGLKVVAEGTETEEQLTQLKQLNCEMAQGYFFSRPADDQAMLKLLARNQSARDAVAGR
jgi:EAL domain-containing protein (putative c-di-GMP-specific phosphodiesterase class I)